MKKWFLNLGCITLLLYSFNADSSVVENVYTNEVMDINKLTTAEIISLFDDDLKNFIHDHQCIVVAKDFEANTIDTFSLMNESFVLDAVDTAYPYFEQMQKRRCCPKGSYIHFKNDKPSRGYVFFNQNGIIDPETAKKFNKLQKGE
jgi:hypothetical protein